ncbi:hypothetical protein BH18ACT4_BH18ACT4_00210 [soil metagenome]
MSYRTGSRALRRVGITVGIYAGLTLAARQFDVSPGVVVWAVPLALVLVVALFLAVTVLRAKGRAAPDEPTAPTGPPPPPASTVRPDRRAP